MLEYCLSDAKLARANTFDLRVPEDAIEWMKHPDLVDDFIIHGGYRLVPISVCFPKIIRSNQFISIRSVWKNTGIGVVPNHRPEWNGKYKLAYALLDKVSHQPVSTHVTEINPANWLKGTNYPCDAEISFAGISNGTYDFAYAIVDTNQGNTPGLNLAITDPKEPSGWHIMGTTRVSGISQLKPLKPIPRPTNMAPKATIKPPLRKATALQN